MRGFAKFLLAGVLDALLLTRLGYLLQRLIYRDRFVRAISYHGTPGELAHNLEKHLHYYRRHFRSIVRPELETVLAGGAAKDKPGLLITFDDSWINHYEVAAPLLEKYGFRGWFFVCSGDIEFIDEKGRLPDNNMTWAQLRELQERGHIVGSHTSTHVTLSKDVSTSELNNQIAGSKNRLEEKLGGNVDSFCWPGGREHSHCTEAARIVRDSGYRYAFTTSSAPIDRDTDPLMIHRTNVEISHSMQRVRMALSGVEDIWFRRRRRQINEILALNKN